MKQKKQPKKPTKCGIPGACRVCGHTETKSRAEFRKAVSPRCQRCGGIIDPIRPLFRARTPQKARRR